VLFALALVLVVIAAPGGLSGLLSQAYRWGRK